MCLAISNPYLDEFEAKSKAWIEEGLNLIEDIFTGTKQTAIIRYAPNSEPAKRINDRPETPKVDPKEGKVEKFDMFYFESIPFNNSIFKKNLRKLRTTLDKDLMKTPAMQKYLNQL